jgi:tetratricopeptide (TPR) repeat protein
MAETVRQIAAAFEEERQAWQQSQEPEGPVDALELAKRRAQDELAEEIFREEEGDEDLYGRGPDGLSKLERDALIGQGIDFQSRGDSKSAIACYEKAVAGGLRLAAAFFTLGMLYLEQGRRRHAHAAFVRAGRDTSYRPPIKLALARAKQ